jgi:hypothetical protein
VRVGWLHDGAGVYTVWVAPPVVVTVWETGLGRERVPIWPPEVSTSTVVAETGTVVVVVPPYGVTTWETVGDEAIGRVEVPPLMVTTETELGVDEATDDETSGEVFS